MNSERLLLKYRLLQERGPLCELCQEQPADDLHELISRANTRSNERARQLSFSKELVALLCRNCHETAHNATVRTTLFRGNIKRYGKPAVAERLQELMDAMKSNLSVKLEGEE